MATQPDFWGELVTPQVRTPVQIMREQASLLGSKTQNLIEAKVASAMVERLKGEDKFRHRFLIVVPTLGSYAYELFSIEHGIKIYPLSVTASREILQTEDDFIQWLRQKLSSPETKAILGNLLAQVDLV